MLLFSIILFFIRFNFSSRLFLHSIHLFSLQFFVRPSSLVALPCSVVMQAPSIQKDLRTIKWKLKNRDVEKLNSKPFWMQFHLSRYSFAEQLTFLICGCFLNWIDFTWLGAFDMYETNLMKLVSILARFDLIFFSSIIIDESHEICWFRLQSRITIN